MLSERLKFRTSMLVKTNLLIFLDIILVNISFLSSFALRFDWDFTGTATQYIDRLLFTAIAATILKIACFFSFKLYQSLWKYAGIYEGLSIILAAVVSNGLMTAYAFISHNMPRSIFMITFFIDVFLIGGSRFAYRMSRRFLKGRFMRHGKQTRVMLIGAGEAGFALVREYKNHPEYGINPAIFIDDNDMKLGKKLSGVPVVGNRSQIRRMSVKYRIDEIIIAIPALGAKELNSIYNECSNTGCKVKILPSTAQMMDISTWVHKIKDVDFEDLLGREQIKLNTDEVSTFIKGKTVLVTGGGGSIGSELCRQVSAYRPGKLIILDNYENSAFDIQNELKADYPLLYLRTIIANIREQDRISDIMMEYKPDIVFHAAAHKHVPLMEENPVEAVRNNIFGTLNVAECAEKAGVKRFVLISTDKAVNPTNIMGATKRVAEMIIQSLNERSETDFVAVRFGNVLGSNGSVIPIFKRQIAHGGPVTVTHPDVTRFFMMVEEAVQLVLQAGAMARGGEIFVLDMGEPVKIVDLARNLIKLSGFEPDKDIAIKYTGLRPGEKLYEELLMLEEGLKTTKNRKIFVAPPMFTNFALIKREINQLEDILKTKKDGVGTCDINEVFEQIHLMVPTYNRDKTGAGTE